MRSEVEKHINMRFFEAKSAFRYNNILYCIIPDSHDRVGNTFLKKFAQTEMEVPFRVGRKEKTGTNQPRQLRIKNHKIKEMSP